MKAFQSFFGVVIGLSLLAAVGAGGFILVRRGVEFFKTLDTPVALALGVASLVVLLGALTVSSVSRWITKRDQAMRLREERVILYPQIIESWQRTLQSENGFNPHTLDEPREDRSKLESTLILHGSSAVITAYLRLRTAVRESGPPSAETWSAYTRMVGAMRADLGSKPVKMPKGEALPWLTTLPNGEESHSTPNASPEASPDEVRIKTG